MPVIISGDSGITTPTYGGTDTSEYLVPVTSFKNRIINGAMMIDQRNAGASLTVNTGNQTFSVDRWWGQGTSSAGVYTMQRSSTAPAGFTNSLLITVTTADASLAANDLYDFAQFIEGFNVSDFGFGTASAATITLSFWVRSSVTGTFGGAFGNNAGNRGYPFTYTISSANTWEQKTVTITGDTSGTWTTDNTTGLRVYFGLGAGSTFSGTAGVWGSSLFLTATGATNLMATTGATFYITGVQLEKGSTATSFDYRPYGQELALCQRYYWRNVAGASFGCFGTGVCGSSTNVSGVNTKLPVTMRSAPTVGFSSIRLLDGTAANAASAISYQSSSTDTWSADFTGSGLTTGRAGVAQANNSTSAYIDASSEL